MFFIEKLSIINISFSSSFTMQNTCATVSGFFLMTHHTIISLNNWKENKTIFDLFLHQFSYVTQSYINSSLHLYMNDVRLSSLCRSSSNLSQWTLPSQQPSTGDTVASQNLPVNTTHHNTVGVLPQSSCFLFQGKYCE